jgi:hypothetical protein
VAGVVKQLQQEREAANRELSLLREALMPGAATPVDSDQELVALAAEIRRERDLARAEQLLAQRLTEAALPAAVEGKIRKQLAGRAFDAYLPESAIADEKEVLAALTPQLARDLVRVRRNRQPICWFSWARGDLEPCAQ